MKRVHFTERYLLNPQHQITVNLIGAGGTGSQVLTCLARIDTTLRALQHPGLHVTVYDPDHVTDANIGRQLFSPSDIGMNKAICLVTRVNHFFGNGWAAVPAKFPMTRKGATGIPHANITITCTDNIKSRIDLWGLFTTHVHKTYYDHTTPIYWLDFGNAQTAGQVVLGTIPSEIEQPKSNTYQTVGKLKAATEMFKYTNMKDEDSGPSCSLAEALEKQDLFINSTLAQLGSDILWKLFREGMIEYHGLYLNLSTMNVNPIKV